MDIATPTELRVYQYSKFCTRITPGSVLGNTYSVEANNGCSFIFVLKIILHYL